MARARKLVGYAAAFATSVAVALYLFLQLDPVAYRRFVFQPVRAVTYFVRELDLKQGWAGVERVRVPEPETVRIAAAGPQDVDIAAAVYRPQGTARAPAVVLLHGSYPWGRKGGLIRLLGARLSERGWLVVAPDIRGFGESADPLSIDDPASWHTSRDLGRVIEFAINTGQVDPGQLFVVGHSLGANGALEGGLLDPRVKALVLIGPSRSTPDEDVALWTRARFAADRGLDVPISPELARDYAALGNIRLLARTSLARADHKPILLIDGELESGADLDVLRDVVRTSRGPIEHRTLPGAGHYCGVRSFFGSETIFVRPVIFGRLFNTMVEFLDRQRSLPDQQPVAGGGG